MWPDIKKYIEAARKKVVNLSKCASFNKLWEYSCDVLLSAKSNFALRVAMALKPFLVELPDRRSNGFFLAKDLETVGSCS